jgi:cation transport protein ChaC
MRSTIMNAAFRSNDLDPDDGTPSPDPELRHRLITRSDPRDTAYCARLASASPDIWNESQVTASLDHTLRQWDQHSDLWVFAYGSLLWKPEFDADEIRKARIYGHHRSLCLLSTFNRGTLAQPGLVLALDTGGSCDGLALRVKAHRVREAFTKLWRREMVRGSYIPQWVKARTQAGPKQAIAFVMNRRLVTYAGSLPDATIAQVLRSASGKCGTSADYLQRTVIALRQHGLRDQKLARYLRLIEKSAS